MAAMARVDRSETRHGAAGITGQAHPTTTTGIIAVEPMMPNDPTRRSALSVALLAHDNSGYEVDCWLADNGQPHGSVRYDTDRAWFTIQGRPAALRELAEALLRCAELTEQTYPAPAAPMVEGVAG